MITGNVVSGLGEGKSRVLQYLSHFENILGFTCYPGTLNICVDTLPSFEGVKKHIVTPEGAGQVDCYVVRINDIIDGAIVKPHRTQHDAHVIEIIAPVKLREKLQLNDGDKITCVLV